jgi:hypothetical protein
MLIPILIAVVAVIALLAIVVSLQGNSFRVERSATIDAPASRVFANVNDLRKWEDWSPWAKIDPNCTMTYDGPATGTGSSMHWSGNSKVGEGKMTINESRTNEYIRFALNFFRPFKANNTAEFSFQPQGSATRITWAMSGEKGFMCKLFGLVMNMDKMVGKDFEKGLSQLKAITEGARRDVADAPARELVGKEQHAVA